MNNESFVLAKLAQKIKILQAILTNYRQENQAVLKKDPKDFRNILKQRAQLINDLKQVTDVDSVVISTPLILMQKVHLSHLIMEIQNERKRDKGFFPQ